MRIIKILLCAVMVLFLLAGCVPRGDTGMLGSGTLLDPYQVATAADLNDVRNDLTASYIQTADIDLSGYANWNPIGVFSGAYDGNNFKITGLHIDSSGGDGQGLFSGADGTVTLENITLENVFVRGTSQVGALLGWSDLSNSIDTNITVTNCHSSGEIYADYLVGGLLGDICGVNITITECSSSCNITLNEWSYGYTGGLIAELVGRGHDQILVSKCFATGDVVCADEYAYDCGGLIGQCYGHDETYRATIINSYAMGDVRSVGESAGLLGKGLRATVTNCYSVGLVAPPTGFAEDESSPLGGLIAPGYSPVVTSAYYDSETSGRSDTEQGTPKLTTEMKTQGTFIDWDFATIWILDSENEGYPHFLIANSGVQCKATQLINSARTGKVITPIRF